MKRATDSTISAVSILTCTKRADCINTLFDNYRRQNFNLKELIVIINNDSLKIDDYTAAAKNIRMCGFLKYRNIILSVIV